MVLHGGRSHQIPLYNLLQLPGVRTKHYVVEGSAPSRKYPSQRSKLHATRTCLLINTCCKYAALGRAPALNGVCKSKKTSTEDHLQVSSS